MLKVPKQLTKAWPYNWKWSGTGCTVYLHYFTVLVHQHWALHLAEHDQKQVLSLLALHSLKLLNLNNPQVQMSCVSCQALLLPLLLLIIVSKTQSSLLLLQPNNESALTECSLKQPTAAFQGVYNAHKKNFSIPRTSSLFLSVPNRPYMCMCCLFML